MHHSKTCHTLRRTASIERLEGRRLLTSTPWNLANGSLIQNWEGNLISQNDDWSLVPGIEGYFQPATGTNRDPRTVTTDTNAELDVTANLVSGNVSNGGVLELQLGTPIAGTGNNTIALQPTNAAADTYLKLYLNNEDRATPVRIQYDLIDVDSTIARATDSRQSFTLQYRVASSGAWTNVPAGYVQFAADFSNGATGLSASIDATLPAETAGAPLVEVRILSTNSTGNDQAVAVDNIRVIGNDVFAFNPVSYNVIEDGGTAQLTVKRLGNLSGTATVNYVMQNGTAVAGDDFVAASGTLVFSNGVDTQTITVTLVDDSTAEQTESFTVALQNPSSGFSLGANASASVTIVDDDQKPPVIRLNELKVNAPDADGGAEFVEIAADPDESLLNVYFVSIEGDGATAPGTAKFVANLSAATFGSAGLLVLAAAGTSVPAGTSLLADADFAATNGILENGTNSFLLIYSTSPIVEGTDLDANNDGGLELPAGAIIIDGIGSSDGGANDIVYGATLVSPTGAFHAATRLPDNTLPLDPSAWFAGDLLDVSLADARETGVYDPRLTNSTGNVPPGAVLTLGAANYPAGSDAGRFVLLPVESTVQENVGSVTIQVYRAGGAAGPASVTVGATGGSATPGADYAAFTQTLSFASGEFFQSFTVSINDDNLTEPSETIEFSLSNASGSTILREGTGRLTIAFSEPVKPEGLRLNELDINPPGSDQPFEFVELRGRPGQQLVNVFLIAIEGSAAAAGTIDAIVDLTGATLGSNGLLLIKSATGGFNPSDAQTGVFTASLFDGAGFENDSNTFMLIYVPNLAQLPATGVDLDVNNTGVLGLDASIIKLDAIGSLDQDAGDVAYGPALPPFTDTAGDAADALVRFPNDHDPFDASAWYFGNLLSTNSVQSQTQFSASNISANFPDGGMLTPGAANVPADVASPSVVGVVFTAATATGVQQNIMITFSEDVSASLDANDFELVNTTTNTSVPLVLVGSENGREAVLQFAGTGNSLGGSILRDGQYRIRVLAGQVTDASLNPLLANTDSTFAFKNADFDGDLDVDFDDLLRVAQNFNANGQAFAQGDANYDGTVDFDDLLALAQRYGTGLLGTTPIAKKTAARKASDLLQ